MMRKPISPFFFLMLFSALSFAYPKGPQAFLFQEVHACQEGSDAYYGDGKLSPKRINKKLVVTLDIALNCAVRVKESNVFYGHNKVTLNIETFSPSGLLTLCNCPSRYEFTLLNEVKKGENIYLVVDGAVITETKAP